MPTIRELREGKKWTRERLAHETNVALRSLARYETGKSRPIPVIRSVIARALGVTPEDITDVEKGESEQA